MLSLDEIKEISFRKSGRNGYNAEDVDNFIEEVVETVEQQNAEKADMLRKMDILAKKIEQYRKDEETVRGALLQSQKLSDNAIKDAKNKASYIIKSAEKKSRAILTEAEMATEREKDRYEAIHQETANLRREIIALYKQHLSIVEEMPSDDDVAAKRAELDEKYPFEPVDDILNADDTFDVEEEMGKAAIPAAASDDEPEEPRNEKFDKLKFGDNYDVE